ncbi:DNA (cytosine-5-)-methyltransferase [Ramlibacter sp. PS4R-6]|uniref:DNA cytosine methyltransferase n=1 Tax=Ramlibacter sp. PS4R-6 TaxID=3133438 RepID=UPI0030AA4B66
MAAESYAFNLLGEDLEALALESSPNPKRTLWLSSRHPRSGLALRRREDPRKFPSHDRGFCDLEDDGSNLRGNLVVGSITELNRWLENHGDVSRTLQNAFGRGELDLVSGGPPCQSFSMAGLRRQNCEKNTLPWEFAKFVGRASPKFVLLENVSGILKPFKDSAGGKFYAWFELAKAFAEIGYFPLCLHVNAKYVGVAQNRQRFLLLAVREDVYEALKGTFSDSERALFRKVEPFYAAVKQEQPIDTAMLDCWDVERDLDAKLLQKSFLSALVRLRTPNAQLVSASDAIGDIGALHEQGYSTHRLGAHGRKLANEFEGVARLPTALANHDLRNNSELVQRRFRLYQVLAGLDRPTRSSVISVLNGHSTDIDDRVWAALREHDFLKETGERKRFASRAELLEFLQRHRTKKRTQRALQAKKQAPATVSIPDDACHYESLRTLTVRELARLQSFPDGFVFKSKITTGGAMRSYEVPQYTQVGNAVPPLLGRALGFAIAVLLKRLNLARAERSRATKLVA